MFQVRDPMLESFYRFAVLDGAITERTRQILLEGLCDDIEIAPHVLHGTSEPLEQVFA
jgi:hypothetical protein